VFFILGAKFHTNAGKDLATIDDTFGRKVSKTIEN
jgi:hypothetical protein